jgi:hypothetical protein
VKDAFAKPRSGRLLAHPGKDVENKFDIGWSRKDDFRR